MVHHGARLYNAGGDDAMSAPQTDLAALEREATDLRSRMVALLADRAKIEEALTSTRQRLSRLHFEMAKLYEAGYAAPPPPATVAAAPPQPRKRPYGHGKAAIRVAVELLKASGRPMHTGLLLDELRKRGIVVEGPAPHQRLSNWLAKARDVVKNDRATGWHLKEWPDPPPPEPKEKPSLPRLYTAALRSEDQHPQSTRDVPSAEDRAAEGGESVPALAGGAINRGFIKGLDPVRHRQRTLEGLAARKARGERLGREPTISQETWAELDRLIAGGASARAAALSVGISPSSAQRWIAGYCRKAV
jgi:hypothetical protein